MNDLNQLCEFYLNLPFNQFLGLKLSQVDSKKAILNFAIQPAFIGNTIKNILHGGVITSVIDAAGGLITLTNHFTQLRDLPETERMNQLGRSSTIDLHVDFLSPGTGNHFTVEADLLSKRSRIVVARMQVHNETDLIAAGSGSYLLGQKKPETQSNQLVNICD
jgi:uncharacterized protein (TIGR00369 family)